MLERSSGVSLTLNGKPARLSGSPLERLSHVLREQCGLTGVKVGCDAGDCGACTVLIDGEPVCACLTPVGQADGRSIETIEGLGDEEAIVAQLRAALHAHGAAQCGVCTPGVLTSAVALDVVEGIVRDARIAVGACSAVAQRMREAERRLIGAPASPDLGRSIEAKDLVKLSPIDDVRASADYRRDAALTLLRRAIDACALRQAGGVV